MITQSWSLNITTGNSARPIEEVVTISFAAGGIKFRGRAEPILPVIIGVLR